MDADNSSKGNLDHLPRMRRPWPGGKRPDYCHCRLEGECQCTLTFVAPVSPLATLRKRKRNVRFLDTSALNESEMLDNSLLHDNSGNWWQSPEKRISDVITSEEELDQHSLSSNDAAQSEIDESTYYHSQENCERRLSEPSLSAYSIDTLTDPSLSTSYSLGKLGHSTNIVGQSRATLGQDHVTFRKNASSTLLSDTARVPSTLPAVKIKVLETNLDDVLTHNDKYDIDDVIHRNGCDIDDTIHRKDCDASSGDTSQHLSLLLNTSKNGDSFKQSNKAGRDEDVVGGLNEYSLNDNKLPVNKQIKPMKIEYFSCGDITGVNGRKSPSNDAFTSNTLPMINTTSLSKLNNVTISDNDVRYKDHQNLLATCMNKHEGIVPTLPSVEAVCVKSVIVTSESATLVSSPKNDMNNIVNRSTGDAETRAMPSTNNEDAGLKQNSDNSNSTVKQTNGLHHRGVLKKHGQYI